LREFVKPFCEVDPACVCTEASSGNPISAASTPEPVEPAGAKDELDALARKMPGGGLAQSAARPGDDDDLAFESCCHCRSSPGASSPNQ
jgi:hypothetical protein